MRTPVASASLGMASVARHRIILAVAGNGKTRELQQTASAAVLAGRRVLCMSFTRIAVTELTSRLHDFQAQLVSGELMVTTMHSWCASLVTIVTGIAPMTIDTVIVEAESLLLSKRVDWSTLPVYDLLLVDEAQDLSSSQFGIVSELVKQWNSDLVAVGDVAQSIYSFQGARPELLLGISTHLGDSAVTERRNENYRCSPAIVEFANRQFAASASPVEMCAAGTASTNPPVRVCVARTETGALDLICSEVIALAALYTSVVVLHRTRAGVLDIARRLLHVMDVDVMPDSDDVSSGAVVQVRTIHGSKGGAWDAVVLAGINDSIVPSARCTHPGALEEERRLLHVALTRARSQLVLVGWAKGNARLSRLLTLQAVPGCCTVASTCSTAELLPAQGTSEAPPTEAEPETLASVLERPTSAAVVSACIRRCLNDSIRAGEETALIRLVVEIGRCTTTTVTPTNVPDSGAWHAASDVRALQRTSVLAFLHATMSPDAPLLPGIMERVLLAPVSRANAASLCTGDPAARSKLRRADQVIANQLGVWQHNKRAADGELCDLDSLYALRRAHGLVDAHRSWNWTWDGGGHAAELILTVMDACASILQGPVTFEACLKASLVLHDVAAARALSPPGSGGKLDLLKLIPGTEKVARDFLGDCPIQGRICGEPPCAVTLAGELLRGVQRVCYWAPFDGVLTELQMSESLTCQIAEIQATLKESDTSKFQ